MTLDNKFAPLYNSTWKLLDVCNFIEFIFKGLNIQYEKESFKCPCRAYTFSSKEGIVSFKIESNIATTAFVFQSHGMNMNKATYVVVNYLRRQLIDNHNFSENQHDQLPSVNELFGS